MEWIDVKKRLPYDNILCVVCYYNDHRELLHFDGADWWEVSNRFNKDDEKISRESWPDYWLPLPEPQKES